MIPTRWAKVLKDLWSNKARTFLVALSVGVGVFAVGLVSNAYLTIVPGINAEFLKANPHGAVLYTSPFGDDELAAARKVPGVAQVEGRSGFSGRVQLPDGKWVQIQIIGVPDLAEIAIDRIFPGVEGETLKSLGRHELWIERSGVALLPVKAGDTVTVEVEKGLRTLRVAALVQDPGSSPSAITGQITAYANLETIEWLGGSSQYTQMLITVLEKTTDEAHVTAVAEQVTKRLERGGVIVFATVIYRPGEHPINSTLQALLAMMGFLGLLALFLSAFLVINTINALIAQHIRQVGIMKAIGGSNGQITGMYLALLLSFGVLAVLLAVPLAGLVNYGLIVLLGSALNFNPGPFYIPIATIVLQALIGLGVPLVAGLVPVVKGTRLTVSAAISNYGIQASGFKRSWLDHLMDRVYFLPRPLLLSIRNTFRKKGRLVLTLSTLILGGAIFIAVFNLRASFSLTIADLLGYFLSDVTVWLAGNYRQERIESMIYRVPGVKRVESWAVISARVLSDDQQTSTEVLIWGPPAGSDLIRPAISAGRWLLPEDCNAIVVGNHFLAKRPDVELGDEIIVQIGERKFPFVVVGFFTMGGTVIPPFVYVNMEYLNWVTGEVGRAGSFRIVTTSSDPQLQKQVATELEKIFKQEGIRVGQIMTGYDIQSQNTFATNILVYSLMVMALLITLVGAIGLTGTMSMNVMERAREIGVVRSYGASNFAVLSMVIAEGMVIGGISWVLGALLAYPISHLLGTVVGIAFIQSPLAFTFSVQGLIIWLVIVVVLSGLASLLPAMGAVRLTVRDVLAYE